jgi:hypothetical protein
MPFYRLTTRQITLRQYVIESPTEAQALEDWQPDTIYDSQPVTDAERIQHIEEELDAIGS